jgi:hypothetical protein
MGSSWKIQSCVGMKLATDVIEFEQLNDFAENYVISIYSFHTPRCDHPSFDWLGWLDLSIHYSFTNPMAALVIFLFQRVGNFWYSAAGGGFPESSFPNATTRDA